jgi:hypothetical protein
MSVTADLWNSLQQAFLISYGAIFLFALGIGIAGTILLAVATIIGRIVNKYIR